MPFTREANTVMIAVDFVVDSTTGFYKACNLDEVTANAVRVRQACYDAGIPVIQLQHRHRADGMNVALNEARREDGVTPWACVPGTPGYEIVPEMDPGDRDIVVTKHRWHGFFGTELLSVLHNLKAEQLLWTGGFTDACLGLSVFEGYFHDYPSALVLDASTCDNEFTHKTAVLTLANWIYDFTAFTTENFEAWARGEEAPFWYAGIANPVPFDSGEAVERHYADMFAARYVPPGVTAAA
jgi:biuret amidohydrolase